MRRNLHIIFCICIIYFFNLGFSENSIINSKLSFTETNTNIIFFSPNFDGSRDTVEIELPVRNNFPIDNWEILICDQNWQIVKKFYGISKKNEDTNVKALINKLIESNEPPVIPSKIEWNGLSQDGKCLPEGIYYVFMNITDIKKNRAVSETNEIILDLTPPSASLSTEDTLFSPNGDGNKDKLKIEQALSAGDSWKAEMRDVEGNIVYRWDWGKEPPGEVEWDGKDSNGTALPEGTFDYLIFGEDAAGNKTFMSIRDIKLSLKKYSVFLSLSRDVFSPKAEDGVNYILIKPYLSETNNIKEWVVNILNISNFIIFTMNGKGIPPNFLWNGKDGNNTIVKDGIYRCGLHIEYESGDGTESQSYPVWVDTAPPVLSASYRPDLFSPDGDGTNDTLFISFKARDISPIKNWGLDIYDFEGRIFKSFKGKDRPPEIIRWNGRSENGEMVESARDYRVKASAEDILGNRIENFILPPVKTDILVERTAQGFKIRISNIEFESGKSVLAEKKTAILDRVAEILNKYKEYRVSIEGHTDNVGSGKKNLTLSASRAANVCKYLLKKGISQKRMQTAGYGFKFPVADNSSDEGRRKNRRVEFILIK